MVSTLVASASLALSAIGAASPAAAVDFSMTGTYILQIDGPYQLNTWTFVAGCYAVTPTCDSHRTSITTADGMHFDALLGGVGLTAQIWHPHAYTCVNGNPVGAIEDFGWSSQPLNTSSPNEVYAGTMLVSVPAECAGVPAQYLSGVAQPVTLSFPFTLVAVR